MTVAEQHYKREDTYSEYVKFGDITFASKTQSIQDFEGKRWSSEYTISDFAFNDEIPDSLFVPGEKAQGDGGADSGANWTVFVLGVLAVGLLAGTAYGVLRLVKR
jgi:hypothetical protein